MPIKKLLRAWKSKRFDARRYYGEGRSTEFLTKSDSTYTISAGGQVHRTASVGKVRTKPEPMGEASMIAGLSEADHVALSRMMALPIGKKAYTPEEIEAMHSFVLDRGRKPKVGRRVAIVFNPESGRSKPVVVTSVLKAPPKRV